MITCREERKNPMSRLARPDPTLEALNDERDQLSIQISLLADAETPDPARLAVLRARLDAVQRRISGYRPVEAVTPTPARQRERL